MLLLGGFIVALAIEKWNLHSRIALNVVRTFGSSPVGLVGGFMVASARQCPRLAVRANKGTREHTQSVVARVVVGTAYVTNPNQP